MVTVNYVTLLKKALMANFIFCAMFTVSELGETEKFTDQKINVNFQRITNELFQIQCTEVFCEKNVLLESAKVARKHI